MEIFVRLLDTESHSGVCAWQGTLTLSSDGALPRTSINCLPKLAVQTAVGVLADLDALIDVDALADVDASACSWHYLRYNTLFKEYATLRSEQLNSYVQGLSAVTMMAVVAAVGVKYLL